MCFYRLDSLLEFPHDGRAIPQGFGQQFAAEGGFAPALGLFEIKFQLAAELDRNSSASLLTSRFL